MKSGDPHSELPKLFSDDEIDAVMKARAEARLAHERWDASNPDAAGPQTDGKPECLLEQSFPHICRKLVSLWGSEVCALYLQNLIVSDREARKGFPVQIVDELLMLYGINEMIMRGVGLGQRIVKTPPSR